MKTLKPDIIRLLEYYYWNFTEPIERECDRLQEENDDLRERIIELRDENKKLRTIDYRSMAIKYMKQRDIYRNELRKKK